MLEKYTKFIQNDIINENYNIKDVDVKVKDIVNRTRDSLLKIKYKFYNIFTNDKADLVVGGTYYTLMQFQPTVQNEEVDALDKLVFLAQIKLVKENDVKVVDSNKGEMDVKIFDYKILGFGSSVAEYIDILNNNKKDFKLIKSSAFDYIKKINEQIGENQVSGFYLFSKDYINIKELIYDKLKINKSTFSARFMSEDDKKTEVSGTATVNKKPFTLFKEKTNPNNFIIYLGVERDFYLKYLNISEEDAKLYKLNKNEFNAKYTPLKNKNSEVINITTYFNSKITEIDKINDNNQKYNLLNKYINYIYIIYPYSKDESSKSNLELLIKNIVSILENMISELRKESSNVDNIKIINMVISSSEKHFNNFNKVNAEIASLFNKLKNKK